MVPHTEDNPPDVRVQPRKFGILIPRAAISLRQSTLKIGGQVQSHLLQRKPDPSRCRYCCWHWTPDRLEPNCPEQNLFVRVVRKVRKLARVATLYNFLRVREYSVTRSSVELRPPSRQRPARARIIETGQVRPVDLEIKHIPRP
jgi:hypothetical protein